MVASRMAEEKKVVCPQPPPFFIWQGKDAGFKEGEMGMQMTGEQVFWRALTLIPSLFEPSGLPHLLWKRIPKAFIYTALASGLER